MEIVPETGALMSAFEFKPVDREAVGVGDVILHNGVEMTVGRGNLKRDAFMGILIFGDSYSLGRKKVLKGFYRDPRKAS